MNARYAFLLKLAGALLLVALADLLFWFQRIGSTIGLFALGGADRRAQHAHGDVPPLAVADRGLAAALFFALALAADPGPLALLLYLDVADPGGLAAAHGAVRRRLALGAAARRPRRAERVRAAARLSDRSAGRGGGAARSACGQGLVLILPLARHASSSSLCSPQANPLIGDASRGSTSGRDFDMLTIVPRMIFWASSSPALWSLLRPPRFALRPAADRGVAAVAAAGRQPSPRSRSRCSPST